MVLIWLTVALLLQRYIRIYIYFCMNIQTHLLGFVVFILTASSLIIHQYTRYKYSSQNKPTTSIHRKITKSIIILIGSLFGFVFCLHQYSAVEIVILIHTGFFLIVFAGSELQIWGKPEYKEQLYNRAIKIYSISLLFALLCVFICFQNPTTPTTESNHTVPKYQQSIFNKIWETEMQISADS